MIMNGMRKIKDCLIKLNQTRHKAGTDNEQLKEYLMNNNEYEMKLKDTLDTSLEKLKVSIDRHNGTFEITIGIEYGSKPIL